MAFSGSRGCYNCGEPVRRWDQSYATGWQKRTSCTSGWKLAAHLQQSMRHTTRYHALPRVVGPSFGSESFVLVAVIIFVQANTLQALCGAFFSRVKRARSKWQNGWARKTLSCRDSQRLCREIVASRPNQPTPPPTPNPLPHPPSPPSTQT
ncbi:hypothetical protein IE53DRAFT_138565 [Violaceomyces palustris]|uniref:Uncharacterized protein n=1 Tax=Violaceomyces palustris TaxID=1673888 RepID=A0ACD0NUK4_9BASI|nr:hypothetical protein IE53DRAFT_138565 [Violaceomyces palustris]